MSDALKDLITVLNKTADALQKEVDALPKEDPFQLAPVYFLRPVGRGTEAGLRTGRQDEQSHDARSSGREWRRPDPHP